MKINYRFFALACAAASMMVGVFAAVAAATFSFGEVKVDCEERDGWKLEFVREVAPDGAEIAKITLDCAEAKVPPKTRLSAKVPQVGMDYSWNVNTGDCGMRPNWGANSSTEVAQGMPVFVYFDGNDTSHFSVAAEECVHHLNYKGGVREEGSLLEIGIGWFETPEAPISHYETRVRFDARARGFADAVREAVAWIERTAGIAPCRVPASACDPLYSSWYCFHQDVHAADIEAELAIAAKLGMKTFILDDGWQMEDTSRGYAFCGDWQVAPRLFPDMAAHVKRVQDMGVKYMVWYSVPFVGQKSVNYERFKGKYLYENPGIGAAVLDPRFPEVRQFLVDTYVKALKDWNIDGFKLDFIDSFAIWGEDPAAKENYAGRDIKSLPLAVDALMTEVKNALTAIKPDILVEFRQSYVGPAIRKYGNMLRVGDCPGNLRRNRFAIANLRLASGGTAVHSDMLEWNFADSPEHAALYVINSMFGVVQYSVMLRDAPKEHLAMVEKWIKFSQDHRDTLLNGKFTPRHPELQYPVIEAEGDDEVVIGLYDDGRVVDVPEGKRTFVMNASGKDSFVVRRGGKLSEVACKSGDWIEFRAPPPPETDWMAGKIGAFVHYWPGLAGHEAKKFDVEQLKRDLVAAGVDYFFLTLGQNAGTYIAPNETYDRLTGHKRGEATAACNGRDIPREVIEALKGTGIKFCLYLPCRGPGRAPEDCEKLGYIPSRDDHSDCTDTPEGLENWCKVIAEWSERYGRDVHAWWFDGAGGPGFGGDRETLAIRAAARRGNPDAVCAFAKKIVDYDHGFRWVLGMDRKEGRELDTLFTDYNCRGEARHDVWAGCDFTAGEATNPMRLPCDGREVLGRQWFTLTYLGGMWGWTDVRHTDNVWSDWMKRVIPLGASVCFDVGFVHEDGRMSPAQVAQLRRIVALARGKPDAETAARHERETKVVSALRDVELAYGRGCENPLCLEDRDTGDAEIRAALDKDGAVFVNERAKATVIGSDLVLKQGQVFIGDKDSKFAAPEGKRVTVKLADGVMFEGGTWKGVDFDLRGCRHFIFRRVWTEDCRVLTDGASECVIEYLTSPNPTPKQVFEIICSGEEASHRVTETQRARGLCAALCMKLRSVGLSLPLRRMDYASHLTFVITRTLLPCFISAASPQGALMGVWGLRPQLKKTLRSLCSLRLTKPAVDLNWGCEMRSCGAVARTPTIGV